MKDLLCRLGRGWNESRFFFRLQTGLMSDSISTVRGNYGRRVLIFQLPVSLTFEEKVYLHPL